VERLAVLDGGSAVVTDAPVPAGPVARSSVARVGTATAISALCGYAVLYLAARALDPAGFSVFGVFWGAFGLVTGATFGLLQESTREIRTAACVAPDTRPAIRPLSVGAATGVVAALTLSATAVLWAARVFVTETTLSVALLAVGLLCACLHATLLGVLAGDNRWTQYGALMVIDAATRVVIAIVSVIIGAGVVGFLWATVGGALSWLLLLAVSPTARAAARLPVAVDARTFLRGAAHAVAAAGASAVLVMGFPVLLKVTSSDLGATGGVVILAVTLTRAPLLVPLTAMQGNLIAHFVDQRRHRMRALATAVAGLCAVGAVGIAAAGWVGPWLLRVGFGPEYQAGGPLLAWLTAGAVAIAVLTVTGAATVAAARHRAYSLGWVGATVVSTLLLMLPLSLEARTVIALLCGPAVGIVVHLGALLRAGDA
jgi:O-antigen/teichoic acid export membrane protein